MSSFIKLSRKLLFSDCWIQETFSRGQAWVDLLMWANWRDKEKKIEGVIYTIKRGQFITSELKLAKRWGWSRGKVRRFLNELKLTHQIEQQTDRVKSTITICNYDKYQSISKDDSTTYDTTNGTTGSTTGGTQLRIDKNIKEDIYIPEKQINLIPKPAKADNSPNAPKWVRRFKDKPLIKQSEFVWLTDEHIDKLLELMVNEQELKYWIKELDNFLFKKPKAYADHASTIKKWWEKQIGSGWTWKLNNRTQLWQYMKED